MDKSRIIEAVCRRLLREAPDLGEIEFSPSRLDGVDTGEADTPEEKALAKEIMRWLDAASAPPNFSSKLKELMSHPDYSRFFHPPDPGSTVYRGKTMSPSALADMLGVDVHDLGSSGQMKGNFTVPVRKNVASWTYERHIADEFANRPNSRTQEDHLAVIFEAHVDDNVGHFVDMVDMVRRVSRWRAYQREEEVLALSPGPTNIFQITWSPMREMDPVDESD